MTKGKSVCGGRSALVVAAALFACAAGAAPFELGLNMNGGVRLGDTGVTLGPKIAHEGFRAFSDGIRRDRKPPDAATGTATYEMIEGKEKCADGRTTLVATADGRAFLDVFLASTRDQNPQSVAVSASLPARLFAGGSWKASNGKGGDFAPDWHGEVVLWRGEAEWIEIKPKAGDAIRFQFLKPTQIYIQDSRRWNPDFSLSFSEKKDRLFNCGDTRSVACYVSTVAGGGVSVVIDSPVTLRAGADWIPLDYVKDIEPGSALDLSGQGILDAPAGKYGWLKNAGGHFAFEKRPGAKQRFCGVNFCSGANFPDKKLADRVADRLARLGYNAVRIHHYESAGGEGVVKGSADGLTLNPAQIDKLDYFLAKCFEKGIYATTDLYVSRSVPWRAIGFGRDGNVPADVFKFLVLVHEPAFANWSAFAKNFLTHVNPYTGRAYKDEPALPLLSLINEGPINSQWASLRREEPLKKAWAAWLAERRKTEPDFARGKDDPSKVGGGQPLQQAFALHLERRFVAKANAVLRDGLGVKALFTDNNWGPHYPATEVMREELYGYVDNHFYIDHPQFLAGDWSRPSRCANENPVKVDALPSVEAAFVRLPTKPYTVSEWSFSGPGAYRGMGGLLTGALAALQDWDGLWRFQYSCLLSHLHDRKGALGYFDLSTDPLSQAGDRAFAFLFLRGDLAPLDGEGVANRMPSAEGVGGAGLSPGWREAAWQVRTAATVGDAPAGWRTFDLLEQRKKTEPPVALAPNPSVALDRERGAFSVVTPKTAGGFAPSGALRAGPVAFDVGDVAATVWASSLDDQPIVKSRRLLVSHLTDVQSDGITYLDRQMKVCLRFGGYPPIVRNGRAKVALALERAGDCEVWALETSGRRAEKLASEVRDGRLCFTADVNGAGGARMLYEVVAKER